MASRTHQIVKRVEEQFRRDGKTPPNPDVILDALKEVQEEIARDALAMKLHSQIVLENGRDMYALGYRIHKLKSVIEPVSWNHKLKIITSTSEWSQAKLQVTLASAPAYVMGFDKNIYFHPAPSLTGEIVEAFMYLLPAVELTLTNNPETPPDFDTALKYGALRNLLSPDWASIFEEEKNRRGMDAMKDITTGVHRQESFTDGLGF